MKTNFLFIALLMLCSHLAFSQTNYKPGYVISNSGDTTHGFIDYRGDVLLNTLCRFKTTTNAKAMEYLPGDISAYRFIDGKYFESKKIKNGIAEVPIFLEFLIKGELNVYYYKDNNGDHYLIEKEGMGLAELPYEEKKVDNNEGNAHFFNPNRHIGLLKLYMQDVPQLNSKIEGIRKPGHSSLIKLATDYHYKSCDTYECVVYEKKIPRIKVGLEPAVWVKNYSHRFIAENFVDRNYLYIGGFLYVTIPAISEKVFFRTGFFQSKIEKHGPKSSKYSYRDITYPNTFHTIHTIPLHLGYQYPKGLIRPKAAYGFNMYTASFPHLTTSLNGGIDIKLNNWLNYSLNTECEFFSEKTPLIPKGWYSLSAFSGLHFSF